MSEFAIRQVMNQHEGRVVALERDLSTLARRVAALEKRPEVAAELAKATYDTAKVLEVENKELKKKLADAKAEMAHTNGPDSPSWQAFDAIMKLVDGPDGSWDYPGQVVRAVEALKKASERSGQQAAEALACATAAEKLTNTRGQQIIETANDLAAARAERGVPVEIVREYVETKHGPFATDASFAAHSKARAALDPYLTPAPAGEPASSMRRVQPGELPPEPREDLYTPAEPEPKPAKPPLPIRERCPRCGHALKCGCGPEQSWPVETREPSDGDFDNLLKNYGGRIWESALGTMWCAFDADNPDRMRAMLRDAVRRFSPPRGPVTWAELGKEQRASVAEAVLQLAAEEYRFQAGELAEAFGLDKAAARGGRCVTKGEGK